MNQKEFTEEARLYCKSTTAKTKTTTIPKTEEIPTAALVFTFAKSDGVWKIPRAEMAVMLEDSVILERNSAELKVFVIAVATSFSWVYCSSGERV